MKINTSRKCASPLQANKFRIFKIPGFGDSVFEPGDVWKRIHFVCRRVAREIRLMTKDFIIVEYFVSITAVQPSATTDDRQVEPRQEVEETWDYNFEDQHQVGFLPI